MIETEEVEETRRLTKWSNGKAGGIENGFSRLTAFQAVSLVGLGGESRVGKRKEKWRD